MLAGCGIAARVQVRAAPCGRFTRLHVRLQNLEPWQSAYAVDRDALLCHSLVSAHVLFGVEDGTFVSLLEPPDDARDAVAACRNRHVWPVLIGDRDRRDLLLASPIILYDYPAVAPESPADLCDGTEIDEILSLRILTLTDDEKREARLTDPRARQIVDRVDAMTPDDWSTLHGTLRRGDGGRDFFNPPDGPAPGEDFVMVGDIRIARGAHVRLRPTRRADTMDMFLKDQPATVSGVFRDVDDRVHVAVTVDADPAAALHDSFGRYFYFDPSEIEPIGPAEEARQ